MYKPNIALRSNNGHIISQYLVSKTRPLWFSYYCSAGHWATVLIRLDGYRIVDKRPDIPTIT